MADTKIIPTSRQSDWQHDDEDSLDDDSMVEEYAPDEQRDDALPRQSDWQHDDEDSLDDDSMV